MQSHSRNNSYAEEDQEQGWGESRHINRVQSQQYPQFTKPKNATTIRSEYGDDPHRREYGDDRGK